ncbi:helix-turn-helix transcriptional regulator [Chryseobacterium sp. GP-SGM7]|uniref:helix-turn-helix transcriptional regulator n=1 Tax=Chryseobacterium sp. GP-SGM7 TaxID=3411323 RepID=UPI003B9374AC
MREFSLKTGNNQVDENIESNYLKLINKYLLFLFLSFLFYSVFILLFFQDVMVFISLLIITMFWLLIFIMNKKIFKLDKILRTGIIFIYLLLISVVSFFHIYTNKNAGVDYFYFSLLFALPFFFNYRKDFTLILTMATIIIICLVACLYFDFNFLPKSRFLKEDDYKTVKLINILYSFITFIMDIFFISQKDGLIHSLVKDTEIKNNTIEDLVKSNSELMKQQIILNNLTDDNISEITSLAENDSPLFIETFQLCFPDFIPNLLIINSKLISSEIHLCALMRLNFDTKKIASCTNSSVRAVESRKYRIRKKLNIHPDDNINNFILKI